MNSEKSEPAGSNADTSIASVETSDNPRVTKDRTKRSVTTVSVDESVTPSKAVEEGVKANNETKDDIIAGIEAQVTNQVNQENPRSATDGGENNVQSAVVTDVGVSAASSTANRKWRHITADCLACVRTRPPSAHELREAFFAGEGAFFLLNRNC